MARLQILELPEGSNDDRPPFVLVVDQYEPQRYILGADQPEPIDQFEGIAEKIGARAVLVFEDTIDIPANDTTAYLRDSDGGTRAQDLAETLARVRAEVAHIRAVTPTWGPVADLIDAALNSTQPPAECTTPDA